MVSQQREGLVNLHQTYASWFCASGPLSQEAADAVDPKKSVISSDGKYSINLDNVTDMLEDMGNFVIDTMDDIGFAEMANVIMNIATCSVELIARIAAICVERDSSNNPTDSMPPVLPHQLVKIRGREFSNFVRLQMDRLLARWTPQKIELIEQNFQDLRAAYEREPALKQLLDNCDSKTTFEQGWGYIHDRFDTLKTFCGGLATAFPGTSTVESDFSIVKWEKDACRISLTDFSLEGILHAKQFSSLSVIDL